ncbi:MAG: winged helix-turn-helix domain-containing protein [candidate division WOR-3 bacterium]
MATCLRYPCFLTAEQLWAAEQLARVQRWREEVEQRWKSLTERERGVLALVAQGQNNREISEESRWESGMVRVGDLRLDLQARRAMCGDEEGCLTRLEFDLLAYLVRNAGRVVEYDELLREVCGYADDTGSYELVRMAMSRLRSEIGENAVRPQYIECVRGVGYRLARES